VGLKYAGVGVRRLYAKEVYSRDCVLTLLREYSRDGRKLKAGDLLRYDRPLYEAARRHFGKWRQVRTLVAGDSVAAAPQRRKNRKWSAKCVIEQIRCRLRAGKSLNRKAVEREQSSLIYAAKKYFGSWRLALAAAGVARRTRRPKPA
jgi:hypothetical protein